VGALFVLLGIFIFFFSLIALAIKAIRKKPTKNFKIGVIVGLAMFVGGVFMTPSNSEPVTSTPVKTVASQNEDTAKKDAEEKSKAEADAKAKAAEEKKKAEEEKKQKEILTFNGDMDLKATNGKVQMSITSNVPDGGIFEIAIMDNKLNIQSDFVPIKDGKITKEFSIPKEWGVGFIAGTALFRFNLEDHPQPDNIKKIYGDKGEKMAGGSAVENNLGGKNGQIEGKTVAYPDEQTVKTEQQKLFKQTIAEMVKVSNGIIVDILPRHGSNKWDVVNVVVSDSWYYSQDYEKERFAEQVGSSVENLVLNAGLAEGTVLVYFVDTYGKTVADPKIFGGYEIK